MKKKLLLALIILPMTVRCASTLNGRYQQVAINSEPSGATVRVTCADAPSSPGVTPVVVTLRRGAAQCSVNLAKPGFREETFTFTRHRSLKTLGNVGSGLLIGLLAGIAVASNSPLDENDGANNVAIVGTAVATGAGVYIDKRTGALYRQVPGKVSVRLTPQTP